MGHSSRLSDFCWLSSLPYLHLPTTSFCWLSHSLDSYLKPTVLFCHALSTALSVFSRTFLPSFTSGLAGDLVLCPFMWVFRLTDKEIVWVAPTQTETNCYASCHKTNDRYWTHYSIANVIYIYTYIYIYICVCVCVCECVWTELALNAPQSLICPKTPQNQPKPTKQILAALLTGIKICFLCFLQNWRTTLPH